MHAATEEHYQFRLSSLSPLRNPTDERETDGMLHVVRLSKRRMHMRDGWEYVEGGDVGVAGWEEGTHANK